MPRRGWCDDEDYGYDRAWDNYYNQCHCEYYPADEYGEEGYSNDCDYCERGRAAAERGAAARKAEEDRLRATGWYDEITTLRGFINRFWWLTGPEYFQARLTAFRDMFTAMLGYERFLAAQPKFRATVVAKAAECRANPAAEPLKDVLDQLDLVLARLPSVEGYKA